MGPKIKQSFYQALKNFLRQKIDNKFLRCKIEERESKNDGSIFYGFCQNKCVINLNTLFSTFDVTKYGLWDLNFRRGCTGSGDPAHAIIYYRHSAIFHRPFTRQKRKKKSAIQNIRFPERKRKKKNVALKRELKVAKNLKLAH